MLFITFLFITKFEIELPLHSIPNSAFMPKPPAFDISAVSN